jgi:hypothetical protein
MRLIVSGLVMALVLTGAAGAATDKSDKAPDRAAIYRTALESFFQRNECGPVLKQVDAGALAPLEGADARLVPGMYTVAALCKIRDKDGPAAHRFLLAATGFDDAPDQVWTMRFQLEMDLQQYEDAVVTIEKMTEGRGAALNAITTQSLYYLDHALKSAKRDALRMRLLRVVTANSYDPTEILPEKDGFREAYAELLLAAEDKAAAKDQVAQIEAPWIANRLSVDPRFRDLVPADLDVRALAERQLAEDREAMARHSDALEPIIDVASMLRQLGRPQEALAVLESARANGKKLGDYVDAEDKLNWWWDGLGRTNQLLANGDAAFAALREGAKSKEGGEANVSQLINLAEAQIWFGKPADALATLQPFEKAMPVSPYGDLEMRMARGCAQSLAGNKAAAEAERAYIAAREKDHPEALSDLLMCMGDVDGAASAFIRRLDDPERRVAALVQLSDYDPLPSGVPINPLFAHLDAIKQRPDVKAAIARAGGTRRFHVLPNEL